MKAEKIVRLEIYSMITPSPAKKQKEDRASREEVQPRKKAMAFVKVVIVMEEPACCIPMIMRLSTESLGFV